jgi:hypothetical protein
LYLARKLCFNSKMVRLKARFKSEEVARLVCFNSKMVRLKAAQGGGQLGYLSGFNSKMVRLKGRSRDRPAGHTRCFNSKMVRLKGVTKSALQPARWHFFSKNQAPKSSVGNDTICPGDRRLLQLLVLQYFAEKPPRSRERGQGLRARARATDDLRALWLGRSDPVGLAGYGLIIQATQP